MDFSIEEYSEEINLTIIEDGDLLEFSVEETVEEINLTIEEYNGADGIGLKGDKPDHEWNGTQLRFENPDDSWGEYVDLKGEDGLSGIQSVVAGDNITIDNTDPLNPVISAEEGGTNVTKTSDLLNDGDDGFNPFISLNDIPSIAVPTKTSDLINDGQDGTYPFITEADIPAPFELPSANPGDVLVKGATEWEASNRLTNAEDAIDAEVVNRAAADNALQTQITTEKNRNDTQDGQITDLNVHSIAITTTTSITTDTTDANGRTQNGREVAIKNGVNAINITCELTSPANFVASYTKEGSAGITVLAGAGTTLYQTDGTNVINGIKGSTFCIKRSGNEFQLQISNR